MTLYFLREIVATTYGVADVWVMRRVSVNSPAATAPLEPLEELPLPEVTGDCLRRPLLSMGAGRHEWYEAKAVAEGDGGAFAGPSIPRRGVRGFSNAAGRSGDRANGLIGGIKLPTAIGLGPTVGRWTSRFGAG